jgi:hypothetical protein
MVAAPTARREQCRLAVGDRCLRKLVIIILGSFPSLFKHLAPSRLLSKLSPAYKDISTNKPTAQYMCGYYWLTAVVAV